MHHNGYGYEHGRSIPLAEVARVEHLSQRDDFARTNTFWLSIDNCFRVPRIVRLRSHCVGFAAVLVALIWERQLYFTVILIELKPIAERK